MRELPIAGALVGALAACSFSGAPPSGLSEDSGALDAASDGSGDAADDAPGSIGYTTCPQSSDVLACYLLDGDGTDGSANNNNADQESGIEWVPGVAGMAAKFEKDDRLGITQDGDTLDSAEELSIEAWLFVEANQTDGGGQRVAVFDNDGTYSLFLSTSDATETPPNAIYCGGGARFASEADTIPIGRWFHIACVRDEDAGWQLYLDGDSLGTGPAFDDLPTQVENHTTEIGSDADYDPGDSHFVGTIDNLIIWGRALSRAQICTESGVSCSGSSL